MALVVEAVANSDHTNRSGTSMTINLPSGVTSGDLIVVALTQDNPGATTPGWPSDWTEIYAQKDNRLGYAFGAAAYHWADSSTPSSISVSIADAPCCARAWRISGAQNSSDTAPEYSLTRGTSTTYLHDPPAITPTGGTRDYMYIALAHFNTDDASSTFDTPDGYTGLGRLEATDVFGCTLLHGHRITANTSEENPTRWEVNATAARDYVWSTIAIYPADTPDLELNRGSYGVTGNSVYMRYVPGYPRVQNTANSDHTNRSGTTMTVNLPSNIKAGELLVCFLGQDNPAYGSSGPGWPSDWTELYALEDGRLGYAFGAAAYHLADGSEGATISVSIADKPTVARVYSITGAENPGIQPPEYQVTQATSTSYLHDPPSITPTDGPKDFLFLIGAHHNTDDITQIFDTPDGYTGLGLLRATDSFGVGYLYGYRESTAVTTENPTNWETEAVDPRDRVIHTVAVHPAGDTGLDLTAGSYAITGQSLTLATSQALDLTAGSYAVTGLALDLLVQEALDLTAGSYALTGKSVDLNISAADLVLITGNYAITGQAGTLTKTWLPLNLDAGSYALAGIDQELEGPPADDCAVTQIIAQVLVAATPCNLYRAQVWKITRIDGTAYRYTTHDKPLTFKGETYSPCNSLKSTAASAGILGSQGGGDIEIGGMIADTEITERDLANGLFDGAAVEVWRLPWNDPTYASDSPVRLLKGVLGKSEQSGTTYQAQLFTASVKLAQLPLLNVFTPGCRFNPGDGKCPLDVEKLTVSGTVQVAASRIAIYRAAYRQFIDTLLTGANPGSLSDSIASVGYEEYYAGGLLTWTSGANNSLQSEVKSYNSAAGLVTLWDSMPHEIQAGDSYTIKPGCNKTQDDHTTKYGLDMDSFGGFPDVPGSDAIIRGPDRS